MAVNDAPGFVSNRVLLPMINEAAFAVMEGVATAEAVDAIMKLGMNHPMGPLELADFIGLDVCVNILDVLYDGFGDPKYRACPLLQKNGGSRLAGPQERARILRPCVAATRASSTATHRCAGFATVTVGPGASAVYKGAQRAFAKAQAKRVAVLRKALKKYLLFLRHVISCPSQRICDGREDL